MKRTLFFLAVAFLSTIRTWSQCVPTCSNYAVMPLTSFTPFTNAGNNAVPQFTPNTDDGHTPPVPIGFSFNFYCTTYTSVLIYTNGLVQFDFGVPSTFPFGYDPAQLLPNSAVPNGMVCFRMDDLDLTFSGAVTYTTVGTAPNRAFVVTYSNVPIYNNASQLQSGQIVLYETSNIIDIYTFSAATSPNLSTQGIENTNGTLATAVYSLNQTSWPTITNLAYRYLPFTPGPPSAITGSTLICQQTPSSYQTSTLANVSYNWLLPAGWSGSSTSSTITAAAIASGVLSVTATYTCGVSAPATLSVTVIPAPTVAIGQASPGTICSGKTVTITPSGAQNYTLYPPGLIGVPPFTDNPVSATVYTVIGTNSLGCLSFNTSTTSVQVLVTPTITVNSGSICLGETFTITPQSQQQVTMYSTSGLFFSVTPTLAAQYTYTVTGKGQNGCVSDPVVSSLTVNGLPTITAVPSRSVICKKETSVLSASGAVTYTWSNASTNHSLIVAPLTNTFYVVVGSDVNGCKNSATVNVTVNSCSGIVENTAGRLGVQLYPNPTSGMFELRSTATGDKATIEIYNAIGQSILLLKADQAMSIDLKAYSNGLYYVKVRDGDREEILKLIKQ